MRSRSSWLPSLRAAGAFLLGSLPASLTGLWLATPGFVPSSGSVENLPLRVALSLTAAALLCGAPALLYGALVHLWRHRVRIETRHLLWACAVPGLLLHSAAWALRALPVGDATLALALGLGAAIAADLLPIFLPRRSPLPEHGQLAQQMPAAIPMAGSPRNPSSPRARRVDEAVAFGVVSGYGLLTVFALHQLFSALSAEGLDSMASFVVGALLLGLPSFLVMGAAFAAVLGVLFYVGNALGSLLRPGSAPPVPYGLISGTFCLLLAWDLWPSADQFAAHAGLGLLLPFASGLLGTLLAPRRA